MTIELSNIKPSYMSKEEVASSEVYLQSKVILQSGLKYLIKANSGHGKTSILNFIYGNSRNFDGDIQYKDESPVSDIFNLRKNKIAYVFQDFKLFTDLTLIENIQLKNNITHHKTDQEIDKWIAMVELDHKKNQLVQTLSLGQRQRVAILRALCQPFEFLLMDEPFSHLDKHNISILTRLIEEECEKQKAGLLLTSLGDSYLFDYDKVLNL